MVLAEVSKEAPLESHLNCSARHPIIFGGQANDFIENDLVTAGVVDDVLAVREFDCVGISEYLSDAHWRDMMKPCF